MSRIIAEQIKKSFRVGRLKDPGALARVLTFFSGREPQTTIEVLRGVSLRVEPGEIVGLIGENGSGKSTLLRILAGIYTMDSGAVACQGRMIALTNLYAGLKDRLNMRDNIYLCGALFGLKKKQIRERFDAIVAFSELESFVNTKVFQFSEGMKQRLVFSIAAEAAPEILLLDEVFAVGDDAFKRKSAGKILELVTRGSGVVFVSHEMWMISQYCHRALWLADGMVREQGRSEEVVAAYQDCSRKVS